MNNNTSYNSGIVYAIMAYIIWGLLPIYWKWIDHVSSAEILASRIVWSFCFSLILVFLFGKGKQMKESIKILKENKKQAVLISVASLIITCNWFIYIWAVNTDHVTEASLGYYINPLISVLLAVIFLKEKLNKLQVFSYSLAIIGVFILTMSYGKFPFVALSLAFSFALYGLAKKFVKLDSIIGLTIETFIVAPIALIYLLYLGFTGNLVFLNFSFQSDFILLGSGIATALPLIFFANGAKQISLSLLGILQYIAPTFMLFIGVFMYHEPFTSVQLTAFIFIWIALAMFTISNFTGTDFKLHRKKKLVDKKATM